MKLIRMAAIAAAVSAAASAHATTYFETLNATAAGFTPIAGFQPGTPGYDYTGADETLTGFTPITVAQGDIVDVTVNFDHPFTIPASTSWTGLVLDLMGAVGAAGGEADFVWTFYDGATPVATLNSLSTSNEDVLSFGALYPPNNGAFTVTSFTDDITAVGPFTGTDALTGALFEEFQATNVPEPATWSLMLAGFAGLGAMLRRRAARMAV